MFSTAKSPTHGYERRCAVVWHSVTLAALYTYLRDELWIIIIIIIINNSNNISCIEYGGFVAIKHGPGARVEGRFLKGCIVACRNGSRRCTSASLWNGCSSRRIDKTRRLKVLVPSFPQRLDQRGHPENTRELAPSLSSRKRMQSRTVVRVRRDSNKSLTDIHSSPSLFFLRSFFASVAAHLQWAFSSTTGGGSTKIPKRYMLKNNIPPD